MNSREEITHLLPSKMEKFPFIPALWRNVCTFIVMQVKKMDREREREREREERERERGEFLLYFQPFRGCTFVIMQVKKKEERRNDVGEMLFCGCVSSYALF